MEVRPLEIVQVALGRKPDELAGDDLAIQDGLGVGGGAGGVIHAFLGSIENHPDGYGVTMSVHPICSYAGAHRLIPKAPWGEADAGATAWKQQSQQVNLFPLTIKDRIM